MDQKNLDKLSILVAVVAVVLTVSIMSLTGRVESEKTETAPADTLTVPQPDTVISSVSDSLAAVPADSLDAYI